MKRKIYQKLLEWKNSSQRKPLVLMGARQVGKTYLVNLFGKNEYQSIVYCLLEGNEILQNCFDILNTNIIIDKISTVTKKKIIKNETLIILDEIQSCPKALTSLKIFCEQNNDYHIIALGSLLGLATHRDNYSYPVGKVDMMEMFPLDFEEFLMANNENDLLNKIQNSYYENISLDTTYHNIALDYYKKYLFVGGMPEVVKIYIDENNLELVNIKQQEIIKQYLSDMNKYNSEAEKGKTQLVYNNISRQLAKQNKKFKYSLIKSSARARDYEEAIEWIELAGIANKIYKLEQIKLPLNAYTSLSDFKVYMNDVGLLTAIGNLSFEDIYNENELLYDYLGGLTENYVYNQLKQNHMELYYWVNGDYTEVDFVTRISQDIVPIEAKSGIHTNSKSLNKYIEAFNPNYAIRISEKNFGFENNIKSVPLYAVFCINNK
ncbi:MAG: ATP-binding protein [Lachnospiraceae bacterium]|nr:ATP-binding protein [Lachnospiraceae bacterium]